MSCIQKWFLFLMIISACWKFASGIVGGSIVSHYPFFVRVEIPSNVCGGTLIAADVVLTAAHCLLHQDNRWAHPSEITVLKNSELHWRRSGSPPTEYSCSSYISHHLYDAYNNDGLGPYDLALVKMNECVDLNNPANSILEPCRDSVSYIGGTAIGLGLTGRRPDILAKDLMQVKLYRNSQCRNTLAKYKIWVDEKMQVCYGSRRSDRAAGTCDGDYGGPLVLENIFIEEIVCLNGVASFNSLHCDDPLIPSVFTNVPYFSDWIHDTLVALTVRSWGSSCSVLK